jgi:AraC-like DNA-binding protein
MGDAVWDQPARPVAGELQLEPALELNGRTDVESIGSAIANELRSREWGYQQAAVGLLRYLVCILTRRLGREPSLASRAAEAPSIPGDQRKWAAIQKALQFCEANFRRRFSFAEIGKSVGYSSRYLSQLMSAHLGHTLADHLHNLRLNEGRRLLEESDLSIGAIADAIGYCDPAHFTRAFSRRFGVSPRAYRRRLVAT